jgi:hypothetical protein
MIDYDANLANGVHKAPALEDIAANLLRIVGGVIGLKVQVSFLSGEIERLGKELADLRDTIGSLHEPKP